MGMADDVLKNINADILPSLEHPVLQSVSYDTINLF
jgi:hypothetical protein